MDNLEKEKLISLIISKKEKKELTLGALALIDEKDKKDIVKIITFLNSDQIQSKIKTKKAATDDEDLIESNRQHILEKMKQSISHSYFDYDIEYFFDLFFPTTVTSKEEYTPPPEKRNTTETKEELNTYMFAYPVEDAVLKKNGKESKQENNPFGFDLTVRRNDPENIALSEIMGIEILLLLLNESGSNTKYWEQYYYGPDKKPNPVHTDLKTIRKVYPNKMITPVKNNK